MNSVAKQDCYIFLVLYPSVGGQKPFTNLDTAEELLLECCQDPNVQSQRKKDIPVE